MKYQALRPQFFSMGGWGWWGESGAVVGGWCGGDGGVGVVKFDEKIDSSWSS